MKRIRRLSATMLAGLAVVLAAGVVTASPASAGCARALKFNQSEGQIDNCPGNGAPSWAWVYNGQNRPRNWNSLTWADLRVEFENGHKDGVTTPTGQYKTAYTYFTDPKWGRIKRMQVCEGGQFGFPVPQLPYYGCSKWLDV